LQLCELTQLCRRWLPCCVCREAFFTCKGGAAEQSVSDLMSQSKFALNKMLETASFVLSQMFHAKIEQLKKPGTGFFFSFKKSNMPIAVILPFLPFQGAPFEAITR
jgi:hypothetical protein